MDEVRSRTSDLNWSRSAILWIHGRINVIFDHFVNLVKQSMLMRQAVAQIS